MADAVFAFEFGEKLIGLAFADLGCRFAAVGGDEVELLRVFFKQAWDVGAAALFEHFENGDFGGVALIRVRPAQALVNVSVKIDPHVGTDAVFDGFDGHVRGCNETRLGRKCHALVRNPG